MCQISTGPSPIAMFPILIGGIGITIITVTSHDRHGVSNRRQLESLFNSLFTQTAKKTLKLHVANNLGVLCQKQVSMTRTNNYIPQYVWDVITFLCLWFLLLAQHSWISERNHRGFPSQRASNAEICLCHDGIMLHMIFIVLQEWTMAMRIGKVENRYVFSKSLGVYSHADDVPWTTYVLLPTEAASRINWPSAWSDWIHQSQYRIFHSGDNMLLANQMVWSWTGRWPMRLLADT